ncbi:hypothetical protein [Xenorhabdus lircayensis]|uniref:Uncharacterized protein n=1 Tax=Xenorhabdus lircayensis TaxID=2763499 RepID=A0ABS0U4M1_9GAMM|nr:hypothetical protein [Xenorhabdus lircayensis]MBI6548823.1 hypothetical protein [Xenorhabdus lircayensis]
MPQLPDEEVPDEEGEDELFDILLINKLVMTQENSFIPMRPNTRSHRDPKHSDIV